MLYVVATPIGNLEDITLRAIRTLKEADLILCEDTRVTGILLKHFEIPHIPMIVINAFSESKGLEKVVERIAQSKNAVLVSDAGTPGISDPGVRLINAVKSAGIPVSPIPGPSAMAAALSAAGVPTDTFLFEGFLPQKKGRQKKLTGLAEIEHTIVLYESAYRIEKLAAELNIYMPERYIIIARELTKKFEEFIEGTAAEVSGKLTQSVLKGEFVVVISAKGFQRDSAPLS